jgi:hypothetical protein
MMICPDGAAPVLSSSTYTCPGSFNTPAICPPGYSPVPGLTGRCVLSTACPAGFQVGCRVGRKQHLHACTCARPHAAVRC